MIVWAVAVFAALPLVVFRGRTLARYLAIEVLTYALAWLLWQQTWALVPYPLVIFFFTAKLALFGVLVATAPDVRWSANRAALLAALVYTLLVPIMTRAPIDGDEPYYLLITESIVHDGDLDLANQYAAKNSASGRNDLGPQTGDPTGPNGEQYSRHEALLPLLMAPGYLLGGLRGAVAIIALFSVLLVRSTMRLLEDEGIGDDVIRAIFPFFAFAPPILFYAARIWPEVPAAWLFVEALRGVRNRRMQRWVPALVALVLMKLRFVLIAVVLVGRLVLDRRTRLSSRKVLIALGITLLPLAVWFAITGRLTAVHRFGELLPGEPAAYARGFFGLLLDGSAGLLFQAPVYLLGIYAITRWRSMPATFRLGCAAAGLYILYLLPRPEWHGGWAPPLRYVVVVMPVLALGAAAIWRRVPSILLALMAAWTTVVAAHGIAYPWRLFHIANGETIAGELLSELHRSDFSRLFPSFIRVNDAAWIAAIALVALFALIRFVRIAPPLIAAAFTLVLALLFVEGQKPGRVVEFEDVHVEHRGGELFPPLWTQARFMYRGGWLLRGGESVTFLARAGEHRLDYTAGARMRIVLDGNLVELAPTGAAHRDRKVRIGRDGRVELRVVDGEVNLDRMIHER
jgi:hypothetical protein